MMLQLNPTISVKTPKGDAEALVIIDYGVNVNSVWLCRMRGGRVLHFYSDDILVYDNPMNGNGWDIDVIDNCEKPVQEIKIGEPNTTGHSVSNTTHSGSNSTEQNRDTGNANKQRRNNHVKMEWWEDYPYSIPKIGDY